MLFRYVIREHAAQNAGDPETLHTRQNKEKCNQHLHKDFHRKIQNCHRKQIDHQHQKRTGQVPQTDCQCIFQCPKYRILKECRQRKGVERKKRQQQEQQKKENYERMLEAVMQDEKELRDKMDEEKAVQGIKVDLEKNW